MPQEKIHAFRTVVHDSGSMLGIFISKNGYQKGAIDAAYCSNVFLKDWQGFDNVQLGFPEKDAGLKFLLNTDLRQKDDDHRLYYVACSRARNRLFINLPSIDENEKALLKRRFGDVVIID